MPPPGVPVTLVSRVLDRMVPRYVADDDARAVAARGVPIPVVVEVGGGPDHTLSPTS
jgi:hypothetical protein